MRKSKNHMACVFSVLFILSSKHFLQFTHYKVFDVLRFLWIMRFTRQTPLLEKDGEDDARIEGDDI